MGKGIVIAVLILLIGSVTAACDAAPAGEDVKATPSLSLPTASATSGPGASSESPPASPTWPPFLQSPTPAGDSTVIAEVVSTAGATATATPAAAATTPAATAPTPGPGCIPAPPPGWVAAVVRPGDTIGRLAQCVGVSPAEIVAVNCLPNNGNLIYSGQSLYLPRPCVPTATPTTASRADGTDTPTPTPPITTPGPPQPGEDGIVIIDPQRAEPGALVFIKFSNFSRNELVTASFVPLVTNVPLTTTVQAYMNEDGVGQVGFFIPSSFPTGRIAVKAEDPYQSGEGLLIVLSPAPTPTATATPTATTITTETPTATPEPTLTPTPDGAAEASATPTETIEPASTPP